MCACVLSFLREPPTGTLNDADMHDKAQTNTHTGQPHHTLLGNAEK